MTASTAFAITPLVGYENVVQISDSGVSRPFLYDGGAATAYVMPKTTGITDGSGNDATPVPPTGRNGNMKTVLLLQLITDQAPPSGAGIIDFYARVNLPASAQGLVPQRFTNSTQWLNTANWPIVDYSKFAPRCSMKAVFFPDETLKAAAANPFLFDPATPVAAITNSQGGMLGYYPGGWEDDATFNPTSLTFLNVGQYGAVQCRFRFAATLSQWDTFELSIDFSHTLTN